MLLENQWYSYTIFHYFNIQFDTTKTVKHHRMALQYNVTMSRHFKLTFELLQTQN